MLIVNWFSFLCLSHYLYKLHGEFVVRIVTLSLSLSLSRGRGEEEDRASVIYNHRRRDIARNVTSRLSRLHEQLPALKKIKWINKKKKNPLLIVADSQRRPVENICAHLQQFFVFCSVLGKCRTVNNSAAPRWDKSLLHAHNNMTRFRYTQQKKTTKKWKAIK